MIKHSNLFRALNTKEIIGLFIDGGTYPYKTLKDINNIHIMFGNEHFNMLKDDNKPKRRIDAFRELFEYLDINGDIKNFVEYFILNISLTEKIEEIIKMNQLHNNLDLVLSLGETITYPDYIEEIVDDTIDNRKKIGRYLRKRFVDLLNMELEYADLKIIAKNGTISILNLKQNQPIDLSIYSSVLTETRLHKMLLDAQRELQDGDFDTIVTKSRTILETTFMYILREHNVKFKKNTTIKTFRDLVTRVLNMQDRDDKWSNDVKKLLSGINKIIDAIGDMRNYHSDAHGRKDMFDNTVRRTKIHLAEAKLLLYSSINVAEYYLDINKRHKENNK